MLPEALAEARDWLVRADRDVLVVERVLSGTPVLPDQAVYHTQQAAEKALKAFLAAHDQPLPRTHNLERLVALCQGIDTVFGRFLAAAQALNPYATQFRYPGGPLEPDIAEAQQALQFAREIVDYVHQQLGV